MKLSANRALLAEATAWTTQAVPKRPTFPALAGVKITAEKAKGGGHLTLEAFDFELGHRASVPAKVLKAGAVLVSGHMAAALIGALRGESVEIELDGRTLTLKAGRSTYRLNTLDLDEYPELPEVDGDPAGALEAGVLSEAISRVAYVIDEANPTQRLRGIRLQGREVIGAHSSGVACAEVDGLDDTLEVWLPSAPLERSLRGLVGELTVRQSEGTLRLSSLSRDVFLRLYSPDPIPFAQFVPKAEARTTLEVDAQALLEAVNRASLTCREDEPITLILDSSEVEVRAGAADTAEGVEYVPAEITGEPGQYVKFGAQLLKGALDAAPAGAISFHLTEPGQRVLVNDKSGSWGYVLMPRR